VRDVVVVWRMSEGAAVQTYGLTGKTPRVFSDASAPELQDAAPVTKDELLELLESHLPFDPRRVDVRVATSLLGWDV